MPKSWRSFVVALALLSPLASVSPATGQTPIPLKVGLGPAVDFLPAFVARDQGIFTKNGLDVTLQIVPTPSVVPPMLVSESVQIAYATPPNILLANEGGLDLVAIAGGARLVKNNAKISFVTRSGVTIEKAEDLKGHRVGVPGFNSIIDMFLRKWLITHNVPVAAVSFVETPMLQMGDLLKSGQIDAATPIEPIRGRIVASGAAMRSVDFFSEVNPDVLGSFWMATRDWATKHKTEVAAFRASLLDGIAYIDAHPDEARAIEQKDMGFVDPTSMATFATKLEARDFDFVAKLGVELGVMKQPVDAAKLIVE
ncbi:MAG TPA: ABC transporter substrate-binding protein [Stellaceae bacterium]|jgi:NitT/TauT family transport system substrate-binding protein